MKSNLLTIICLALLAVMYYSEDLIGNVGDPSGIGRSSVLFLIFIAFSVINFKSISLSFKKNIKNNVTTKLFSIFPLFIFAVYLLAPIFTTTRYDIEVLYTGPLDEIEIQTGGTAGIMKKGEIRKFEDEGNIKYFTISLGRGKDTINLLEYNHNLNDLAPFFGTHLKFKFTVTGNNLSFIHEEIK